VRVLYFDCVAGISGDMALGALIDAGADFDQLHSVLTSLPVEPFTLEREETETFGVRATKVTVRAPARGVIRTYASIRALLDAAPLPTEARNIAQRIFRRLAEAEARVHRKEVDLVTFHEFGEIDSIVDIAGTALALSSLEVERVFASTVPTGLGMVKTEHGALPIPTPTVVELLRGAPLYSRGVPFEMTTPTGAAILAALVEGYGEVPLMRLESVGYGAGRGRPDFPNVLRVLIGVEEARRPTDSIGPLPRETAGHALVPDLPEEGYDLVLEALFEAGARDAWLTPVVTRGGRSSVAVTFLCPLEREGAVREALARVTGAGPEPPPVPTAPSRDRAPAAPLRIVPDEESDGPGDEGDSA
jgi:hypothetical protein